MGTESGVLTCQVHSEWKYNLGSDPGAEGPGGVPGLGGDFKLGSQMEIPGGVFMCYDGTKLYPTVHGMRVLDEAKMNVGLSPESTPLNQPIGVNVGAGNFVVTNTGRNNLKVGERFVVGYPTAEESAAQKDALKMTITRQTHGHWKQGEPFWGGFLATYPRGATRGDRFKNMLQREITQERVPSETVMALGKLITRGVGIGVNPVGEYWRHYATGQPAAPPANNAILVNLRGRINDYQNLVAAASELVHLWDPLVEGIVMSPLLGNGTVIPPGGQFYGFITFN